MRGECDALECPVPWVGVVEGATAPKGGVKITRQGPKNYMLVCGFCACMIIGERGAQNTGLGLFLKKACDLFALSKNNLAIY